MSDIDNFRPIIHNDISIDDEDLYGRHSSLIKQGRYEEAANLLFQSNVSGATASLLNVWEQKIYELDNTSINYIDPYLYKDTEPTSDEMIDKTIWSQEY